MTTKNPLNRKDRLEFLATMHEVYALNEVVETEEGKILTFESREYHNGMARHYWLKHKDAR